MEEYQLNLPFPMYLYSDQGNKLKRKTKNPIVRNMTAIWHQVRKYCGDTNLLSIFSPIWGNEDFLPGRADQGFKAWANNGLEKILDLYDVKTGNLLLFEDIVRRFDVPHHQFFKYLQIRNFISKKQNNSLTIPEISSIEKIMTINCLKASLISKFYKILVNKSPESSIKRLQMWVRDLQEIIPTDDWNAICARSQSVTINTNLRMLQYRWIMRTYITPTKLNKFNKDISDLCVKCGTKGSLLHCLWLCPKIETFWNDIVNLIQEILAIAIPKDPKLFILGKIPNNSNWKQKEKCFVELGILLAKRVVVRHWKNPSGPSTGEWFNELVTTLPLEKATYIIRNKQQLFYDIWGPFIQYLGRTDSTYT